MDTINDITSELFQKASRLMGLFAKSLFESKFEDLLNQQYTNVPAASGALKPLRKRFAEKSDHDRLRGAVSSLFLLQILQSRLLSVRRGGWSCRRQIQPDVKALEAWLASEEPYKTASETFRRSTGFDVSSHHMREAANEIAGKLEILDVAPTKEQIESYAFSDLSRGRFRRPILMLGIDGAHAPVRTVRKGRKKRARGMEGGQAIALR